MNKFIGGDKVDIYHEGNRIFKDLIIEHFNSDTKQVHFIDKDFSCHVDDLRYVKKPEPVAKIETHFMVVERDNKKEFNMAVSEFLNHGWTPLSFTVSNGIYYQTMAVTSEITPNHLPEETK